MDRLFGDPEVIKIAQQERKNPGGHVSYVNWEAIDELPDEFEAQLVRVNYNIDKHFDKLQDNNYYPRPEFMNDIANKRGIRGILECNFEAVYEEIDINPMLCKPLDAQPNYRKMLVGKRMTKAGYVIDQDGTEATCLPCMVEYNAWTRACKAWRNEEEKTEGYNEKYKKTNKQGNIYFELFYYDKKEKRTKSYDYYPKYDTPYKRANHFEELKLFDQRNADTKSKNVVIRTICGMPTGYTAEDLKRGYFIFHRICRSREALKLEQAARLTAISKGIPIETKATNLLFSEQDDVTPEAKGNNMSIGKAGSSVVDISDAKEVKTVDEAPPTAPIELAAWLIKKYTGDAEILKNIPADKQETLSKILIWLADDSSSASGAIWEKAIGIITEVENDLPEFMRVTHENLI